MHLAPEGPGIERRTRARGSRLPRHPRVHARAVDREEIRPGRGAGPRVTCLAGVLSGVLVSVAWWVPETLASAALGWAAAVLLVFAVRARRTYLPAYACGLACCSLGFYWIFGTLSAFGGFGPVVAGLIFSAYVALTATQFLLFALIHHQLGPGWDAYALRSPTALVLSELVAIRLFHWHFGHTQIAFTPLAQIADIGGSLLVSFLMFWLAEAGVRVFLFGERRKAFLLPVAAFGLALGYGFAMIRVFSDAGGPGQEVVLVQGNVSLDERFDAEAERRGVERYNELSRRAAGPNSLVVWPEGAIPAAFPSTTVSAREETALPWIGDGSAFLLGTYWSGRPETRYNAAVAVLPDGRVPRPYFKQILIPFGEAMPLASTFPWLNRLNANAGAFTAGTRIEVFDYPMRRDDGTPYRLRVAPLICYEDTVPSLARRATLEGAELLVNLTYDTWFGRTVAAHEHHLIAAFRAIENRRFLVRATNTGLSGVVDPLGRTIATIPEFSEGTVSAKVRPMTYRSAYTTFVGERPWWALLVAALATIAVRMRRGHGPAARCVAA